MKPSYPLFVLERDDSSIRLIEDEVGLLWYEAIDVEDKLYAGWDVLGYPIELYLDHGQIKVRRVIEQPNQEQLQAAILEYVRRSCKNAPFTYAGFNSNMVELFRAAEVHIKKFKRSTLRQKL